jgi:hypothetical protein
VSVDNVQRAGPPCKEHTLFKYVGRDYDSFDNTSKSLMSPFHLSPNICYEALDKTSQNDVTTLTAPSPLLSPWEERNHPRAQDSNLVEVLKFSTPH